MVWRLLRGWRLFEARRLLEEIRHTNVNGLFDVIQIITYDFRVCKLT